MMSVEHSLAAQFRAAAGASHPLRVAISAVGSDEPSVHTLDEPFALIGQAPGCQIRLAGKNVGFRHAYLQVIDGRLYCVDLGTKGGVLWDNGGAGSGWLTADRCARVGGYEIRRVDEEASSPDGEPAFPSDYAPLEQFAAHGIELPQVDVEFLAGSDVDAPVRPISRVITLVGRAPGSKFQLKAPDVSKTHCSLVLTPGGLWVVDLLGRSGTRVDRRRVRFARLDDGRLLGVGRFQMRIRSSAPAGETADELQDGAENVVEENTAALGSDSASVLDSETDDASDASGPLVSRMEFNKVFVVERVGSVTIIMPRDKAAGFRYRDVHSEANQILQLLSATERPRLIVDLEMLNYSGSELIGALIRLARHTTDHGGGAMFCNASEKMQKVLHNMSLAKLWPYHPTRGEALAAMNGSE